MAKKEVKEPTVEERFAALEERVDARDKAMEEFMECNSMDSMQKRMVEALERLAEASAKHTAFIEAQIGAQIEAGEAAIKGLEVETADLKEKTELVFKVGNPQKTNPVFKVGNPQKPADK